MKKLSWKPKRRGNIYCAPACGRGCTYAEFVLAQTQGKRLAKRLGRGWEARIWENLGWHYEAVKNHVLRVHRCPGCYHAYFAGGVEEGKTPEEAIKRAMEAQRNRIKELQAVLRKAQE